MKDIEDTSGGLTPAPKVGLITVTQEALAANLAGRPAAEVATIEWFRNHAVLRGWTYDVAARKLHKGNGRAVYSRESLYHVLNGFRQADVSLAPICKSIEAYRRKAEPLAPSGGFVETRMFREIRGYLVWAREEWKIGTVVGANSGGKTTSIGEVERQDPRYCLARMPEGGHLTQFLQLLASKRGYGDRQTTINLANRMITEFPLGSLLAVDEFEECFRARSTALGDKTLSYIRRVYDSGTALALVVDPFGYQRIQNVPVASPLRKLASRRLEPLVLPAYYKEDLDLFAAQYGLEPAPNRDLKLTAKAGDKEVPFTENPHVAEDAICSAHNCGLLMWLGMLRRGQKKAKEEGRENCWSYVMEAYALHKAMEGRAARLFKSLTATKDERSAK